ncbi:hypothetical protein FDB15_18300 [Clostridium botulinum]|nr:hypothetical protein [Clostridium botulinum]NFI64777.1 hypothetical protein [Clostridium botulinum]NFJ45633.1 hypothetical protein [Clostridium botulinum]NFJ49240.1 hypothetical protein [Clostridium botulinum]NFK26938.1 hypothetical protein [Clostridium botulinum]
MKKFLDITIKNEEPKKIKLNKEEKRELKEKRKKEKFEIKELKNEEKKVFKSTKELIPIADVNDIDIFLTKDGYIDIYQVESKDIYAFNQYEADLHVYNFIAFLRNYLNDFKLISMNFPVNTSRQQEYIRNKLEQSTNEINNKFLQEKLDEFMFLEQYRNNKEFFIMFFAKNKQDITSSILKNQTRIFILKEISLEKKIKIIFKLNNLNTKLI